MNRRSFLRGVAAAAVAIPLAPLLPKVAPLGTIGSAPGELVTFSSATYTPKYLYGRALMYDWSGPYRQLRFTDDELSRAIDAGDKWLYGEAVA